MPKQTPTKRAEPDRTAAIPYGPGLDQPNLDQMTEAGQRSLAALAELHSRAFRDALAFNAELLDFARRRISADIQTSDRLARCQSVTEAMDALSDFYQGAFRDYAEETTALARLGTRLGVGAAGEAVAEATQPDARKG